MSEHDGCVILVLVSLTGEHEHEEKKFSWSAFHCSIITVDFFFFFFLLFFSRKHCRCLHVVLENLALKHKIRLYIFSLFMQP